MNWYEFQQLIQDNLMLHWQSLVGIEWLVETNYEECDENLTINTTYIENGCFQSWL